MLAPDRRPAALPRPQVGPATPWRFPEPQVSQLDNGLTIWAFDLPGQHVISAELYLDAPLCAELTDREGVATLALRCSDEGSLAHPGVSLAEAIESQGVDFDGHAGPEGTSCGIEVPDTCFEPALGLLDEITRTPAYNPTDVARLLSQRRAEIAQLQATSAAAVSYGLAAAVFAPTCRAARPDAGTLSALDRLTPAELQTWHDRYWRPQGATLILAGELPKDAVCAASDVFGCWAPTDEPAPAHEATQPRLGPRAVWVIDRPDAVQADIRIGGFGPDRTAEDWAALQVGAAAVGGIFGSRLNRVLREERGYTYGANFGCAPRRRGGSLAMAASCRLETAADAVEETLRLLDVSSCPLSAAETADAVNYLVEVAPLRYETAAPIAMQASAMAGVGLGCDWINAHYARLARVDAEAASAAFSAHVHPDELQIVVCGPAEALVNQLASRGLSAEVVSPRF